MQHKATGLPLTAPRTFTRSDKFLFFDATQLDKKGNIFLVTGRKDTTTQTGTRCTALLFL